MKINYLVGMYVLCDTTGPVGEICFCLSACLGFGEALFVILLHSLAYYLPIHCNVGENGFAIDLVLFDFLIAQSFFKSY